MKLTSTLPVFFGLLAAVFFSFPAGSLLAQEEQGMSSRRALDALATAVGDQVLSRLVSMKGLGGVPQPDEWEVICHDPRSPTMLHRYRVEPGHVRDEGIVEDAYPTKEPAGFIEYEQLRLDSIGAFTIAEVAATQAKMGFDSLNLTLRCREYSREPVWILQLIDAEGFLVGKVHLSGNSARVFRTIWIYRDELIGGKPRVVDSALLPAQELTQFSSRDEPRQVIDPTLPTDAGAVPSAPAPGQSSLTAPPATIPINPGDGNFVPPAPAPPRMERKPVPTSTTPGVPATVPRSSSNSILPPIPPELLQEPTVPDTSIPPPP